MSDGNSTQPRHRLTRPEPGLVILSVEGEELWRCEGAPQVLDRLHRWVAGAMRESCGLGWGVCLPFVEEADG